MIVVIGSPVGRRVDGVVRAAGLVAGIARTAAGEGRAVQLVGRVGDDDLADAVVLDLARSGVGHVALLRDASHATTVAASEDDPGADAEGDPDAEPDGSAAIDGLPLDPTDVDLGLRYLTAFDVAVMAAPADPAMLATLAEAAGWAGAKTVVIVPAGGPPPVGLTGDAVVLEAPGSDPDGAFAMLVGRLAAALDSGRPAEEALHAAVAADGWTETPAG